MKNSYEQLREIQQERFNSWANEHMFFAFNMDQFREGMKKLGLDPEDIENSPALSHGLAKAAAYVREHSEF